MDSHSVFPVATDLPPAPESLLQLIRCIWSSDCSSMGCICSKNGIGGGGGRNTAYERSGDARRLA